jgi:arsenite-transporting ATPase
VPHFGATLCYHLPVVIEGRQRVRVIVFTGRGGAGVSMLAAGTAAAIAGCGRRTLAFGVGPGLATAFAAPLGQRPRPLVPYLWAMEAAPERHDAPGPFLAWLRDLFAWRRMDETLAEDIAALPGLVDLARLLALEEHIGSSDFDAVVVDCPALRHTLDLLAALDAATRSLGRMFPARQPTVLDPFLRALGGYSTTGDDVYEAGRDLLLRLARLREALTERESASVRLVLTPETRSLAEVRGAIAALSLFAYAAEAAFCNCLLPEDAGGRWFEDRRRDQQAALSYISDSLAPLPVLPVPLQQRHVSGLPDLAALAAVAYREANPAAVLYRGPAQAFSHKDGDYVLSLALPFVRHEALAIERLDDALIVHLGERSRTFDLPPEVRDLDGVSSAFDGDALRVTFSH